MCQSVNNTIIWFFINCRCCKRGVASGQQGNSKQLQHEILNKVKQHGCVGAQSASAGYILPPEVSI